MTQMQLDYQKVKETERNNAFNRGIAGKQLEFQKELTEKDSNLKIAQMFASLAKGAKDLIGAGSAVPKLLG